MLAFIVLIVFANRKVHESPYILVIRCENEKSETEAMNLVEQSVIRSVIKTKTVSANGIELTAEIRMKDVTTTFWTDLFWTG